MRSYWIFFVFCLISCISDKDQTAESFFNRVDAVEIDDHGQFIYVSSTQGKDTNDGTKDNPVKSIKKGFELSDSIRLKAGDVFYSDSTLTLKNQYISRYDHGANPVLKGFKRPIIKKWETDGSNIWRINLAEDNYTGVQTKGSRIWNNIGCIYEYDKDKVHGYRVRYKNELRENWDYWQTESNRGDTPVTEFDNLFLYYSGNPNELNLEFSTGFAALQMENSEVNGVDFVGFGFGIVPYSNSIIRNCNLDVLGGIQMVGNAEYGCYGNGIEFYVWKDIENCLVEGCSISRCYDCAVTIQGEKCGQATPRNIIIRNNLIYNCCQGWEDFLRNDDNVHYENCCFESNIVLNSGTTGWRYPSNRFKYCHVLGNNYNGNRHMIIKNNKFIGGNYYCSGSYDGFYKSNVWIGNECYLKRGNYLIGEYMGAKDVVRVPTEKGVYHNLEEATDASIIEYRRLTGDMTTKFIVIDDNVINRMVNEEKRRFLIY